MKVARALGLELDEWQRRILDVALEVDDAGRLAFREVRLSLGRQNGKTLLAFVAAVDRMLAGERRGWGARQRLLYGAQTGGAAREKVLDTFVPILEDSRVPFDPGRDVVRSNGRESFRLGTAKLSVLYGGKTSGHGGTNDMAILDECFAHLDATLETGARPTMLTRSHAQIWKLSAAGATAEESPYWWDAVDDLRERSEAGEWGAVCGFEWSAPDDLDRDDLEAWRLACPALACGRISLDVIRAERESMDDAQFDRSILNRWGSNAGSLFPMARWAALADPNAVPGDPLHASVDVSPGADGGRSAAIVVCGWQGETPVLEVIDHAPGVDWAVGRFEELHRRHRFSTVSVDGAGPVRLITDDLRRIMGKSRTKVFDAQGACVAAQGLHEAVLNGTFRHRGDPRLTAAAAGAAKRLLGDSWALRRRDSTADIAPLVAAGQALRTCVTTPRVVSVTF